MNTQRVLRLLLREAGIGLALVWSRQRWLTGRRAA